MASAGPSNDKAAYRYSAVHHRPGSGGGMPKGGLFNRAFERTSLA